MDVDQSWYSTARGDFLDVIIFWHFVIFPSICHMVMGELLQLRRAGWCHCLIAVDIISAPRQSTSVCCFRSTLFVAMLPLQYYDYDYHYHYRHTATATSSSSSSSSWCTLIAHVRKMAQLGYWLNENILVYSVSQQTGPLQLMWYNFTNSQRSLTVFGRDRPYSILPWLR